MKDTAKPRGVDGDERSRQSHQAIGEPCQRKRNAAYKTGISEQMEQMDREEQMEQEEPRGAIYIEPSVYAKEEQMEMRGAHKAIRGANRAIGPIQSNGADRVSGATGANRANGTEHIYMPYRRSVRAEEPYRRQYFIYI